MTTPKPPSQYSQSEEQQYRDKRYRRVRFEEPIMNKPKLKKRLRGDWKLIHDLGITQILPKTKPGCWGVDQLVMVLNHWRKSIFEDHLKFVQRQWGLNLPPRLFMYEMITSNLDGDGIAYRGGDDLVCIGTDVNSDANAIFAAPVRNAFLMDSTFRINAGIRSNQYGGRIACNGRMDALRATFDNRLPHDEAEACFRLIGCSGGRMSQCSFLGNRIELGVGAFNEHDDPQTVNGLEIADSVFSVTSNAPQVLSMEGPSKGVKMTHNKFIIPDGKQIAALADGVEILFAGNTVSRDGGKNFSPVQNSDRDFKHRDSGNLGLIMMA